MCWNCPELIFLYASSTSDWIHPLPFSTQWPLHPSHPWLRRHHPRNPTKLLVILEDPWDPALPQPDFPGKESGRDPHPAQIARNDSQAAPHHQPTAARLQEHQIQDRLYGEYQVPAQRRTGNHLPSRLSFLSSVVLSFPPIFGLFCCSFSLFYSDYYYSCNPLKSSKKPRRWRRLHIKPTVKVPVMVNIILKTGHLCWYLLISLNIKLAVRQNGPLKAYFWSKYIVWFKS